MKLAAVIAAIVPFVPAPYTPSGTFDWPLPSKTVLREFDELEENWHPGHRGVDVAGVPGEPVRAAGSGTVIYARRMVDTNIVSIEHDDRLRTTYQPVTASVKEGDVVELGDVIGTLDEGHCLMGACLHWGVKRGDVYYDPLSLLPRERVRMRLYPVSG